MSQVGSVDGLTLFQVTELRNDWEQLRENPVYKIAQSY